MSYVELKLLVRKNIADCALTAFSTQRDLRVFYVEVVIFWGAFLHFAFLHYFFKKLYLLCLKRALGALLGALLLEWIDSEISTDNVLKHTLG